jgi:hypothetical protein
MAPPVARMALTHRVGAGGLRQSHLDGTRDDPLLPVPILAGLLEAGIAAVKPLEVLEDYPSDR